MTPEYKTATYAEAEAAAKRGERVELKSRYGEGNEWRWWSTTPATTHACDCCFIFRIPIDPYAEYKAAQAQGKVIQHQSTSGNWFDVENPVWDDLPPDRYRVKLVIESGRAYRTRDGRKALIYAVRQPGCYPIHGAIFWADRSESEAWTADGHYALSGSMQGEDLIAPWTDDPDPYDNWAHVPAWANWQAMDENDRWAYFAVKPTRLSSTWDDLDEFGAFGVLPRSLYPTNFTGTWEQSLQERPKPSRNCLGCGGSGRKSCNTECAECGGGGKV